MPVTAIAAPLHNIPTITVAKANTFILPLLGAPGETPLSKTPSLQNYQALQRLIAAGL
ncbi:hypothetical protein ALQ72_05241 [Pseudomonas syringae pv. maculicola]|nr:hypothetical protein ALQ72_05241 [Pseudomonas syringae pv. maculicola]